MSDTAVDWRVLAFASTIAIVTALLTGVLPLTQARTLSLTVCSPLARPNLINQPRSCRVSIKRRGLPPSRSNLPSGCGIKIQKLPWRFAG